MIKLKSAFIFLLPVLCILVLTTVVLAQDVPAPYIGLQNPFAWDDADARIAGREIYQRTCVDCHGAGGQGDGGVTPIGVDISTADFHNRLVSSPDRVFWIVSEGFPNTEMPAYRYTLSVTERWQVVTYLWSLGNAAPEPVPPPPPAPVPPPEPVAPPAPVPPPEPVAPPAPVPPPEPVAPPAPVPPPEPVAPPAPVPPPEPVAPPAPVPPPEPVAPPAPVPSPAESQPGGGRAGGIGCGAPARASDQGSIGAGKLDISFILGGAVFLLLRFVGRRRF